MKLKNTLLASALLSAAAFSVHAATELTPEQAAALNLMTASLLPVVLMLLAMRSPPCPAAQIKKAQPPSMLSTPRSSATVVLACCGGRV